MTESVTERKRKDDQVRETINNKLIESGEREKLKELLNKRLIECGWRDEMKKYCKDVIKNRGIDQITVEELVSEISPKGRATVPEPIKAELLQRIRTFLQSSV